MCLCSGVLSPAVKQSQLEQHVEGKQFFYLYHALVEQIVRKYAIAGVLPLLPMTS